MKSKTVHATMDDVRAALAHNLKLHRKKVGLSQERLALEAGIDRTMLSKIERLVANPSVETLLKLSNRLGLHVGTLLEPPER